jgi:hypothetical protein
MSILGLDIGTTGTKGIVFNEEGKVLASHYLEYKLLFPNPGWVEFDTADMWDKVFEVLRASTVQRSKKTPLYRYGYFYGRGELYPHRQGRKNIIQHHIFYRCKKCKRT